MNGGSIGIGRRADADAVASADAPFPFTASPIIDDTPVAAPDWRLRMVTGLALAAGATWIGVSGFAFRQEFFSAGIDQRTLSILSTVASPLILIAAVYLLVVRTSRSEGERLARVSHNLRGEQARLEASLAHVSARIEDERVGISDATDRLMTIGEEAGARLHSISETLRRDIDQLARQAEALRGSAAAARSDTKALLTDLPKAHAQTDAMTAALEAAGVAAHAQATTLDVQIAALVARGREADEIAGGAAHKLAAQLARIEGASTAAGAQLTSAADTMTGAIEAALAHAATAADAARQSLDAQGAAMLALVEQGEAGLLRSGQSAADAIAARVADVSDRINGLAPLIDAQGERGRMMVATLTSGIDSVDGRFAEIDATALARNERLSETLAALARHATTLWHSLRAGGAEAEAVIGRVETLLTALGGVSSELGSALPMALAALDGQADATRTRLTQLAPEIGNVERSAGAALDRLIEAEAVLARQRDALSVFGNEVTDRLRAGETAANDLLAAIDGVDARARGVASGAAALLVDAMMRVRETAQAAADRASEALAAIVPASAQQLNDALTKAMVGQATAAVETRIADLATTADRSVAAAGIASDRLMRQMLTIAETSAQVEARIGEAHAEIEAADSDTFSRRVALLIESLNSTAIDVTKLLSNEVTDSAWSAYLKGDRGVFTRRAVRLIDAGEVREVLRHYHDDGDFRDQVNRYVHDFEAMLRNVLATRSGSPLGVTLLSSDMGKLYVALAQAIERLRN